METVNDNRANDSKNTDISTINNVKNTNNFEDFIIKLKEPICKIKVNEGITCSTLLKDRRFAIGSNLHSIIIFNKKTFKPDLIIKEHKRSVYCLTQLSSGILASCSLDQTIKLFDITENKYKVIQNLNYHKSEVCQIIELNNKNLVSCSYDSTILFYSKENNEYIINFKISTNGSCSNLVETKENEICYSEGNIDKSICFFDFLEKKNLTKINNIADTLLYSSKMITKSLLLIGGFEILFIINVNTHNLINKIDVSNSEYITNICILNKNILLTSDSNSKIKQWKIEGDNLTLISKKGKLHEKKWINTLLNLGDGHFISGGGDGVINYW